MSNEQKIEKIRAEIKTSPLLDDHEKADWLNLVELMNDKQVGELEEILKAPSAPRAAAPSPAADLPTMSHISNLPTQMNMGGQEARLQPVKPQPVKPIAPPAQMALRPTMPTPTKTAVASARPASPVGGDAKAVRPINDQLQPAQFDDLENLADLDLSQFRKLDPGTISAALEPLILNYGYFTVLENFEATKLYQSYIATGKKLLANSPLEPRFNLTQTEFEDVTDILQSMRMNKA